MTPRPLFGSMSSVSNSIHDYSEQNWWRDQVVSISLATQYLLFSLQFLPWCVACRLLLKPARYSTSSRILLPLTFLRIISTFSTPSFLMLELCLVRSDAENAFLTSPNGITHYKVVTTKGFPLGKPAFTQLHRFGPASTADVIAEIEWKRWSHPIVKSTVFDGQNQELEVREFLYKIGSSFSS